MAAPDILDSRYSCFRLMASLGVATVGNVGIWAVVVIMPALQAEFAIDRAASSVPYVMTMAGFAIGNLVMGRLVDRIGIFVTLLIATVLIALGFGLAALANSILVVDLFHLLIGIGTGASFGPLLADISHWFARRRGIAVALAASGNYLAGAIWPIVLGGILTEHGWRGVYIALAAIAVATMVPLAFCLRRKIPAAALHYAATVSAQRSRSVDISLDTMRLLLAVAGVGCCIAMSMPQVHMVALAVDLGCAPIVGAQILSVMLLGGVVSRIIFGVIADKLGGPRTLIIGSTLQCFALGLYLPLDGVSALFIVSFIFGLSQGGIIPSYAVIVREYFPPNVAGAVIGFVIMSTIVGMALGGWISGYIHDVTGSYQMAFLNGIAWNALNIAIMLLIIAKTRTPHADPIKT
ncbi:MAG: MFS transporter [Pseudomonadota bacterium]